MPQRPFSVFWHRNLRVERSPEHLTASFGPGYFLSSLLQPRCTFCMPSHLCELYSHPSMLLSSPKFTTSRCCISPYQLWYSTILKMFKNEPNDPEVDMNSSKATLPCIMQCCSLFSPSPLYPMLPFLLIVPCILTLHLPAFFPWSCPEFCEFWQGLYALGQASWHWPQLGHSEFFWGKMIIAHPYCAVSVISIWKLMILLAFKPEWAEALWFLPTHQR